MSSVECLREFVKERLTAAAEEIIGVFQKTIVEYEEEIDRQRRLLEIFLKPEVKLHRIEFPQQHVSKEEEVLADQQICDQETTSSLDQEDPGPPQIKEEQKELSTSQEGEQLKVKQEIHTYILTPTREERDHREPETTSDHQLLSDNSPVAETQDQTGGKDGDLASTGDAELQPKSQDHSHSNNEHNPNLSEVYCNPHTGGKSKIKCDTCGKDFKFRSRLIIHMRSHTGEKPYSCKSCGRLFSQSGDLTVHMRREHTGEKPYLCQTCGLRYSKKSALNNHTKIHTGEKPFFCKTCGKNFTLVSSLKNHMIMHTDERPFLCKTCGKAFSRSSVLKVHIRSHTGEKPYLCKTCGKTFSEPSILRRHMRIHTGEKPYVCTCGRAFRYSGELIIHMRRAHTGEKPYLCKTCGKRFFDGSQLSNHIKTHIGK